MIDAAYATCEVGLKMQRAMTQFQLQGLFDALPKKSMKVRIGIHTDSGYGSITGRF
jgi:hypothetical protein